MTLKQKREIEKEANDLCDQAFEFMQTNELAKDLWRLSIISDNWTLTSERLENSKKTDLELKEQLKQEYTKNKKEFYELFIKIVKKHSKEKKNKNADKSASCSL